MYTELVKAIICPQCGGMEWRKYGVLSCSAAPFEAICANCGYRASALMNRRLCPWKEFVFVNSNGNNVRHLECYICEKVETEFEMIAKESTEEKTIKWGYGLGEGWTLPGEWIGTMIQMGDFDGNPVKRPIVFCSQRCRNEFSKRK